MQLRRIGGLRRSEDAAAQCFRSKLIGQTITQPKTGDVVNQGQPQQ